MAKMPGQYANQPELVNAVIEASPIQMDTGDTSLAIEWLMEHHPMSQPSATRVLEHATFQYVAMYPNGHPRLEGLTAELKELGAGVAKSIRVYDFRSSNATANSASTVASRSKAKAASSTARTRQRAKRWITSI